MFKNRFTHLLRRGFHTVHPKFSSTPNVGQQVLQYPNFSNVAIQLAPTHVTELPNGIRVVSEERRGETASVGVFIKAGSRNETKENNGVAHFLEHMYFKGTSRRTEKDLEAEFENSGAFLNGHTTREYTAFTSHCLSTDLNRSVDALSDILLHSEFNSRLIEKERGTILQEIDHVNQIIEEALFDNLHSRAFPDSSLGYTILGPQENVLALSRSDMIEFRRKFYTGNRMVVTAVGNVNHEELVETVARKFESVPVGSEEATPVPAADFLGGDHILSNESIPLFHCAVGFEGPSLRDNDILVLNVIQLLCGQYDRSMGAGRYVASPLCRRIAEGGLARSVSTFNHAYSDKGLFGLHLVGDGGEDTQWLLWEAIGGLVRLGYQLTQPQLARAKNLLKTQILTQSEGNLESMVEDIGRQMLFYNRRVSPAEMVNRVDQITVEDVQRVIDRYVYDKEPVVAAIGNTFSYPDYQWVRSYTSTWKY